MKKIAGMLILILYPGWLAHADPGCLRDGMQLQQRHHYTDAVRTLHGCLSGQPADAASNPSVHLGLGMACLAKARLYGALHDTYLEMLRGYLDRLDKREQQSQAASRLVKLFQGKAGIAGGDPATAIDRLNAFLKTPGISETARLEAFADLGTALHAAGNPDKAADAWRRAEDASFPGRARMAAAYCHADPAGAGAHKEIKTLAAATGTASPDAATTAHLLTVLSRFGTVDQALSFALQADLRQYMLEEHPADNKQIRFYDPFVFSDLERLYSRAALSFLLQARKTGTDTALGAMSLYHLARAYDLMNRRGEAAESWRAFLKATPKLAASAPELLQRARARLSVLESDAPGAAGVQAEDKDSGVFALDERLRQCARKGTASPVLLAKVQARLSAAGAGDRVLLHRSLGRYFTALGDTNQALHHLEAGRDKANKNRIEANPPEMLSDLAKTYYRNRQYSESLEILFEMSKQFPAVRRIQCALQGVYAMDQQSAGDAKLF